MTDPSPENSQSLDDFSDQLQDTVIDQARRLINQSQYTKALLSTLPIALMSTDRTGRICSVNRAAEELLAPRGKSGVSECFPKDPGLREKFDRCLNSGEKFTLDSHTLWTAAGEQNVVNVYLQPLYDDEEDLCGMLIAIEDQTYISFLQESVQRYASPLIQSPLVAESATMKRVADNITKHAEDDAAVLICGDPGTGKTYLAGKLHEAAGLGSTDPFIVVDCRTLDAENARQFLFGSSTAGDADRGEFRFRSVHDYGAIHLADRGSFVLQHVDALPPDAQEALLEYLERGPGDSLANVKVRISLTSSEDLERRAGEGNFDKRLMERIRPRTVQLPTLLKRRKDILPLARLFLEESEHGAGKRFGHEAENLLLSRRYNHNNVRELREAVDLAAQVATGEEILPEYIFTGPKEDDDSPGFVLSRLPLVRWAYQDKTLALARNVVLLFFLATALTALLVPHSVAGQFANGLGWGVWWPVLLVTFLLLGRLWCSVCPFSTAANLAKRLFSRDRPPPAWLKRYSYLVFPAGFLLIMWLEHVFHMTAHPVATGILLLTLIGLPMVFATIFERETWCRYLCPLGNLGSIYSLPAVLNVRANPNVCKTRCTTHECHKGSETQPGCPVFHHPLYARDAHVCKLCFNCLKSCPHDSAQLHIRPPLLRIWRQVEAPGPLSLFALVMLFFSPVLLSSQSFPVLAGVQWFSLNLLLAVGLALSCQAALTKSFSTGDEKEQNAMPAVAFALMVLGWGPLMAFHLGNFPEIDTVIIRGSLAPIWDVFLPEGGISLLLLLQWAAILFSALLSAITMLGIRHRLRRDRTPVRASAWLATAVLSAGYVAVNLYLTLP